jgi:hypothetical protein
MPKGWFFEIHEDTPEQEAANLMEHSASVLDISSDDDLATKDKNEELERGKENIPPPDWLAAQPRNLSTVDAMQAGVEGELKTQEQVKRPRLREFVQDAMDEDRRPLGDLPPSEFYGEGCDASTYVTVDAGIEKPSSLSKEFDFGCSTPEEESVEKEGVDVHVVEEVKAEQAEELIAIYVDEPAVGEEVAAAVPPQEEGVTALLQEVAPVVEGVAQQEEVAAVVS